MQRYPRWLWFVAAASVGLSCGGEPRRSVEGPLPAVPTAGPSSTATAVLLDDAATLRMPEMPKLPGLATDAGPGSADADELLGEVEPTTMADLPFLRRVCRTAVGKYVGALVPELNDMPPQLGCECCAPFESCPPEPSSKPTVANPRSIYQLRHRHEGSYTAPGRQEIAATFFGCESGAENRGGTIVLRAAGDRFETVTYRSGVNPDKCQNLRRKDGRDLLLCEWGDGQGGIYFTRIIAYDLADDSFKSDQVIAELVFEHLCFRDVGMRYVRTKPKATRLEDLNGDGQLDVVLEVEHVAGTVTNAQMAECRASADDFPEPKTLPPAWHTQLHFLYDGRAFTAAPKTKQRLRRMDTSTVMSLAN